MAISGTLLPFASDGSESSFCQKPTFSDHLAVRMTEGPTIPKRPQPVTTATDHSTAPTHHILGFGISIAAAR